jgi:hypothetical protein
MDGGLPDTPFALATRQPHGTGSSTARSSSSGAGGGADSSDAPQLTARRWEGGSTELPAKGAPKAAAAGDDSDDGQGSRARDELARHTMRGTLVLSADDVTEIMYTTTANGPSFRSAQAAAAMPHLGPGSPRGVYHPRVSVKQCSLLPTGTTWPSVERLY